MSRLDVTPVPGGIALFGEVDLETREAFAVALRKVIDAARPRRDVVIELSGLSFIDARGVTLLSEAGATLQPPARLVLRDAPRFLLHMAEVMRVDGFTFEQRGPQHA